MDHRNIKNLKLRTKLKNAKKSKRRYQNFLSTKHKKRITPETADYTFEAPVNFSIINNDEDTIKVFNDAIKCIMSSEDQKDRKKKLYFDLSKIKKLTIEAIMYLLAIINNLSEQHNRKCIFTGNLPENPFAQQKIIQSGFLKYVRMNNINIITRTFEKIQIRTGNNVDTKTAKEIIKFVMTHISDTPLKWFRFLTTIFIELMTNTFDHAYEDDVLEKYWYIYVEKEKDKICFSFLDTGVGIPQTVSRDWTEKIDFLKLKKDYEYIDSALNGEFRTKTRERNRGKGLPSIFGIKKEGKIDNLIIISGDGYVKYSGNKKSTKTMKNSTRGTIVYWEIDLNKPREV